MDKNKLSEAEIALGGKAGVIGATDVVDPPKVELDVPPGYEPHMEGPRSFIGPTEPVRFKVALSTQQEILQTLRRPFVQITRINRGKAIVRFSVYDVKHDDPNQFELIAVVTGRYAISDDGRVSGPFLFIDDSWSQYQNGHNSVIERLAKVAATDENGKEYFAGLCKRAGITTFVQAQGGVSTYVTLAGPLADDIAAFANKYREWIVREVVNLEVRQKRVPAAAPAAPAAPVVAATEPAVQTPQATPALPL